MDYAQHSSIAINIDVNFDTGPTFKGNFIVGMS